MLKLGYEIGVEIDSQWSFILCCEAAVSEVIVYSGCEGGGAGEHVARTREKRGGYKALVGILKQRNYLEDPSVDVSVILKMDI